VGGNAKNLYARLERCGNLTGMFPPTDDEYALILKQFQSSILSREANKLLLIDIYVNQHSRYRFLNKDSVTQICNFEY